MDIIGIKPAHGDHESNLKKMGAIRVGAIPMELFKSASNLQNQPCHREQILGNLDIIRASLQPIVQVIEDLMHNMTMDLLGSPKGPYI